MVKVRENLTGLTFGRLTVLKQIEDHITPNGDRLAQWLCECSCTPGKQVKAIGKYLKNGDKKSCGCLHIESAITKGKNNKKQNKVDLSGSYGVGWTNNTNREFYFDLEDYDKIKKYGWFEHVEEDGYACLVAHEINSKKLVKMSQIIKGSWYDHEDRNPFNNQKNNLRPCTAIQNAQNRTVQKRSKSGVTGVTLNKKTNKWQAKITVNKKQICLGSFIDIKDAIKTRLSAEKQYFGEFAGQKHLYKEYGIE